MKPPNRPLATKALRYVEPMESTTIDTTHAHHAPSERRNQGFALRPVRLALRFGVACLLAAGLAFAQGSSERADRIGDAPLAEGTAVTQALDTSHLLRHLDVWGWSMIFEADEPFDRVSVALVAMTRVHLDEDFTRTVVGGGLTVQRPVASDRADVTVLLDGGGDPRDLTIAIDGDTSGTEATLPAPLSAGTGLVGRPYGPGHVVPTDPEGRLVLLEIYPDANDGVMATGDVADMLAYLAIEIAVE